MKILVVGSGGREHAIIKKLKESKRISEIFALPGNGERFFILFHQKACSFLIIALQYTGFDKTSEEFFQ